LIFAASRRSGCGAATRHPALAAEAGTQATSERRNKARQRVAALQRYAADLRRDFAHQASKKLVDDPNTVLLVFEDLKIPNMLGQGHSR
jgi:transposase